MVLINLGLKGKLTKKRSLDTTFMDSATKTDEQGGIKKAKKEEGKEEKGKDAAAKLARRRISAIAISNSTCDAGLPPPGWAPAAVEPGAAISGFASSSSGAVHAAVGQLLGRRRVPPPAHAACPRARPRGRGGELRPAARQSQSQNPGYTSKRHARLRPRGPSCCSRLKGRGSEQTTASPTA